MKNISNLRYYKSLIFLFVDILICFVSLWLAFSIRLEYAYYPTDNFYFHGTLSSFFLIFFFTISNNYKIIFRNFGIEDLKKILITWIIFSIFFFIFIINTNYKPDIRFFNKTSVSIVLIQLLLIFFFLVLSRVSIISLINIFFAKNNLVNIAIYGAGAAGITLAKLFENNNKNLVKYYVDDNKSLQNSYVNSVKILSYENLLKKIKKDNIKEIFIAIPSIKNEIKIQLIKKIQKTNLSIKILPNLENIIKNTDLKTQLKTVKIEDLLNRNIYFNEDKILQEIKDKTILITGAGGSIGQEICKQILNYKVKAIILIDNTELNLFNVENIILNGINKACVDTIIKSYLVSASDKKKINDIFSSNSIDVVFHAAAYKHVELLEKNLFESYENNLLTIETIINASHNHKVKKVICISTDKAVHPSNNMGLSKRLAEIYIEYFLQLNKSNTIFSNVRFGNVLGSSGSVVPIFQKQINTGGPVTVTDPNVTRFFMTIPEAVKLILEVSTLNTQNNYYLNMGDPVRILDLAKKMIYLSGFDIKSPENPNGKIEIIFTGLKRGEKLHEELFYSKGIKVQQNSNILIDPHRMRIDRIYQEQFKKIIDSIYSKNKEELVKSINNIKLF